MIHRLCDKNIFSVGKNIFIEYFIMFSKAIYDFHVQERYFGHFQRFLHKIPLDFFIIYFFYLFETLQNKALRYYEINRIKYD